MSNATQQLKAKQRREKFAELLREMFQLNQPELDFGLYRIMHARKDDINRFIEQDLPRITQEAFSDFASQDKAKIEEELVKARQAAEDAGFNPDESPKVQELEEQLKSGFDLAREEGEVYDALITFFNRYYSEGDFISRRVYKNGTYAIPYQGEEVVLHWANKDQYYIKSSTTLRDYTFRLNPHAQPGEDPKRVHFKLVDADAGAKDNNKDSDEKKRVFVLDTDNPFEITEGEFDEEGNAFKELQLRFHFRQATTDDWTDNEKSKATETAAKKPPTQEALYSIAEASLLDEAGQLPDEWKALLQKPYIKYDGKLADYSVLKAHLDKYSKGGTFDYFIHKNLGAFLKNELDFYIKNELLNWTDLATLKNHTTRLSAILSKVEVTRAIGEKIIAFLAQLENFQKKLWLKRKFITKADYCITLDRLKNCNEILEQVISNKLQIKSWEELYSIDLSNFIVECKKYGISNIVEQSKYRYMMVDTKLYSEQLKAKVLSTLDNIDKECDGVIIKSDNFQALNLLEEKYESKLKCIYIDPPYNTGGDGFIYKDGFQSSSWLSLMQQVMSKAKNFMSHDGLLFISNDDNENENLRKLLQNLGYVVRPDLIWNSDGHTDNQFEIKVNHEYITLCQRSELARYGNVIDPNTREGSNLWKNVAENSITKNGPKNPYSEVVLPIGFPVNDDKGCIPASEPAKDFFLEVGGLSYFPRNLIKKYDVKFPIRFNKASYNNYALTQELTVLAGWANLNKLKQFIENGFHPIVEEDGEIKFFLTKKGTVYYRKEKNAARNILSVLRNFSTTEKMKYELEGMGLDFTYPKPNSLVSYIRDIGDSDIYLDFFAGSGTTAQSIIDFNRDQEERKKYILVEMGRHFDTVVKPRIIKHCYARQWSKGNPSDNDGVTHLFKYMSLESYEDTLGNLNGVGKKGQRDIFVESKGSSSAAESYLLKYMLDVETRGSKSLLDTSQFVDPNRYMLDIRSPSGDETKSVNIDLLETFNYLLGLDVEYIASPLHFDAQFKQGEYGRWEASVKQNESGKWWFRTVYGTNQAGQRVLVVWRNLPSVIAEEPDGVILDNAVLDAVLIKKLKIRLTESQDDEVDVLYVNGDHNIAIPKNRKGDPMEQARIQLIEDAFHRLMFADTE